jgi:SAM-dependent methyltransferase
MTGNGVFDQYSRYYDLLYRDKDYEGEVRYLQGLLARYGLALGDILEFGSGTGKHGRLLGDCGYRVHGIERSPEMVARAVQTGSFTCEVGDIQTVRTGKTYNAVLSLFHVVSYQTANEEVKAVLSNAHAHLRSGGLFAFDVWYSPAVYAQRPSVRVKRMADEAVEITRIAEPNIQPNRNRVDVHYTIFAHDLRSGGIQVTQETHAMRYFSLPEIDFIADACGFERVAAEEFLTAAPPSENTWGVFIVLQKV